MFYLLTSPLVPRSLGNSEPLVGWLVDLIGLIVAYTIYLFIELAGLFSRKIIPPASLCK